MGKFGSRQIMPLAIAALAVLWIAYGLINYGLWARISPTSGFVPVVIAAVMLVISLLDFWQSFKEEPASFPRENWLIVYASFVIFGATFLIGLLPTLALFVLLWLKVYEKAPWGPTLIVFVLMMALSYGVFVMWLNVHFPRGILFNAFLS